jgi:hypothetical protein
MSEFKKCYLIGAGASYGHNDQLSDSERPPTTEELFVDSWEKGILDREEFEPLLNKIVSHLGISREVVDHTPGELKYDVEKLLKELQEEMNENVNKSIGISESETQPQIAISLCYYLLYELFRHYTKSFTSTESYYTALANHFNEIPYSVISLNYDMLLEKAIKQTGQDFYYFPQNSESGIPIAKIHGSINLLNDFGVAFGIESDNFIRKVKNIHSNNVHSSMCCLDVDVLEKLSFRDLVFELDNQYEPAIIPPLAKYKNYDKVEIYPKIWTFAEDLLQQADELIIIGSSLTTTDNKLLDLLEENLKENIKVTVVSGSQSDEVRTRLNMRLENPSFDLDHKYFGEYIESL